MAWMTGFLSLAVYVHMFLGSCVHWAHFFFCTDTFTSAHLESIHHLNAFISPSYTRVSVFLIEEHCVSLWVKSRLGSILKILSGVTNSGSVIVCVVSESDSLLWLTGGISAYYCSFKCPPFPHSSPFSHNGAMLLLYTSFYT